jgi:hypothetical protein
MLLDLLICGGKLVFPSLWLGLRGSLCFILYIVLFCFSVAFHSYLSSLPSASPVILAYIWLAMLVTMLG